MENNKIGKKISMRFKEFISEKEEISNPKTKATTLPAALAWVKQHAPQFLAKIMKGYEPLYRGMPSFTGDREYHLGDSSTFTRKSLNADNYYTKIISSSDDWKDYPSREHAYICATGDMTAAGFGDVYCVIPEDSAEIGICPTSDIWSSFSKTLKTEFGTTGLNSINVMIKECGRILDGKEPDQHDANSLRDQMSKWTLEDFRKMSINKIEGKKIPDLIQDNAHYIVKSMARHNLSNFEEYVDYVLDPSRNGFEHKTAAEYRSGVSVKEVWVEGKALFVRITVYKQFIEDLKNG